jgi:MYXO-CTERM domain-containing protein
MNHEALPVRRNLKLALLAGTCLTASATGARSATTITETTDFANDMATALLQPLPVGTTDVSGNVFSGTDPVDMVAFTSLLPGSAFTLEFTASYTNLDVLDSSNVHVGSPAAVTGSFGQVFTGTVPADGILVAQVAYNEGSPYTISLSATTVPEPSAAVLGGLGVAAAALRRTRRTKKA